MRRSNAILAVIVTLGIVSGSIASAAPSGTEGTTVYLALGDSLAASVQAGGDRHSGYAEQLFQLEQPAIPDLRLIKLGCPGETTRTFAVAKARCPYRARSQLDQAIDVLERRDVAFVTLQIGSNDLLRCFRFEAAAFDGECVDLALPRLATRLSSIVAALRAAGPDVTIVGANYYDPLLAAWTFDPDAATAIAEVWTRFNRTLEETYAGLDVPVADVEAAFSTLDASTIVHVPGLGQVPLNVARICQWTFACAEAFDPHPNTVGYSAITRAWGAALDLATP
jgi:lysophospholipase L1-like esterase